MSRIEENSRLVFKPDMAMRVNAIECAKVKFLEDISRSLAVIADRDEKDDVAESDAYVRDHMLIEFIISCIESGTPCDIEIEEWYDAWQKKLKELEAKHND